MIPSTCKSVKCKIAGCKNLASHKVGEENIWFRLDPKESNEFFEFENTHNLTTYLCEEHFNFVMTRETNFKMEDHRYD